ncbi:MAG: AsnC family transcriptional regulator [Rhodospirillaceae bacterium]
MTTHLDAIDRRLLDEFQHDFPLDERPFQVLGLRLSIPEDEVLTRLERLVSCGIIARIGAMFRPHRVGVSTLAALSAPTSRLDEVAALVSGYEEVTHNYIRDHAINLWFVVTAGTPERLAFVLAEIATRTGLEVLDLPMARGYRVDMGFPLWT